MKCLQCGTELDRLSKWRGSSEYCSEECKRANQDEFNQLAMNRLMQPRPAKTNSRATVGAVRTVESGAGRLTVVTHPVGASSPILTEPPEAGFIMEASAVLADLQLRHQPPVNPRPLEPFFPSSMIPMGSALLALEAMLSGVRPQPRGARKYNPVSRKGFVVGAGTEPALVLPSIDPVWIPTLGLIFHVAGLEQGPAALVSGGASSNPSVSPSEPVSHGSIPSRRPARVLPRAASFELGEERLIAAPVVSPPRLRIHLPKPALHPFRPRYAFAPPPEEDKPQPKPSAATPAAEPEPKVAEKESPATAVPVVVVKPIEKPVEPRQQKANTETEDRKKNRGARNPRPAAAGDDRKAVAPAPKVLEKIENKPEPKPEIAPAAKEDAQPVKVVEKAPVEKSAPAESVAVPSFGGNSEAEPEGFWSRMPLWQKAVAALVIVGAAIGIWAVPALKERSGSRGTVLPSAAAAPASVGVESWQTEPAADMAGAARRRVINLYKPARTRADYIVEFSGQIEQRAMGWVFRMKDARNYYCLKLEKRGNGPAGTVQLVKFAVVNGEEQPHRLVELREPLRAGQSFQIRLDVKGQNFSTQVNGRPVDDWIDSHLASGTVWFSNESGQRAVISNVKVSY